MEEDKAHMERSSIHKTDKENARTREARGLGVLYLMRAVSTRYNRSNLTHRVHLEDLWVESPLNPLLTDSSGLDRLAKKSHEVLTRAIVASLNLLYISRLFLQQSL